MNDIFAASSFDCCDRDGNVFVAVVQLGQPFEREDRQGRSHGVCPVSLEPLFPETAHEGEDTFSALCLAIELIRKALRAFTAHGGTIYFRGTRSPIDINDPSFCTIAEPIYARFLSPSSADVEENRGWPNGSPKRLDE